MGSTFGTFYGVGVGPGDPELITRKAERILRSVDWIYHPSSRGGDSFVRRIIAPLALDESKFRIVALCMSRDRRRDRQAYDDTVTAIAHELQHGKSAAWITEGDPLFYSTFCYLHERMRQRFPQVPIEIVPGVTSILAASARAGVTVAHLDDRVAVVPAAYGLERLPALLDEFAIVFLIKVHSVLDQLVERLADLPWARAVFLEKVGTAEERIVTDLRSLRGQYVSYFSLVIVQGSDVEWVER